MDERGAQLPSRSARPEAAFAAQRAQPRSRLMASERGSRSSAAAVLAVASVLATVGVLSGVALALHFGLWISSLDHTTVAASVVLVCTQPIFVTLLAWLVLKEKTGPGQLVGIAIAFVVIGWVMTAAIVDQSEALTSNLNSAVSEIREWLDDTPVNDELAEQVRGATGEAGSSLTGGIADRAISIVDSALGFVTGLILGTIVFYYLLKDGPTLAKRWAQREEDEEQQELLTRIGERAVYNVQNYFRGRTAMALVNGAAIGAKERGLADVIPIRRSYNAA